MNNYIHPLQQQAVSQKVPVKKQQHTTNAAFKDMLQQQTANQIKVSKHAQERLTQRNISINEAKWQVIGDKMQAAKQKGITDALILTEDAALIVSTKNNTVVTALHQDEAQDKIFTNINGTILI